MLRPAGRQRGAVSLQADAVMEPHRHGAERFEGGLDPEQVVVEGRFAVTALHLGHREEDSLPFRLVVGNARLAHELGPADLEPTEIVGVIGDAHLVRVAVDDPVGGDVLHGARRLGRTPCTPDGKTPVRRRPGPPAGCCGCGPSDRCWGPERPWRRRPGSRGR